MVYTVRISAGQGARVVDIRQSTRSFTWYSIWARTSKNPVGLVEKITTYSKRLNGREKILSHVNSCPWHLYKTKIRHAIVMYVSGSWQNSFSLSCRELYRIIFGLKVLLICICVYLPSKITLRDICHELSKQPSEFTSNWFPWLESTHQQYSL